MLFSVMSTFFPKIKNEQIIPLRMLVKLMEESGVEVLDEPNCPYPDEIKEFFKSLYPDPEKIKEQVEARVLEEMTNSVGTPGGVPVVQMGGLSGTEHLISELSEVYAQLGTMKIGTGGGKDQLQVEKTKIAAIEKIVSLKERLLTLKQLTQFQSVLMKIVEQVLTPEQREQFLDELKDATREG